MPVDHYENFPVASLLLPSWARAPIEAIYHFARSADDLADEGNFSNEERLDALNAYIAELDKIAAKKNPQTPLFARLSAEIDSGKLPLLPFYDLIDAFKQDVVKKRYANYAELLDYCRRSANPVGRLVLCVFKQDNPTNFAMSDAICTSLQLINFWQDVAIDWQKDRIYLPKDEMARFLVGEAAIAKGVISADWQSLMSYQLDRSEALMREGAPLVKELPGRLGIEIRLTIQGGLRIIEKIRSAKCDVYNQRPTLTKYDIILMIFRSFFDFRGK